MGYFAELVLAIAGAVIVAFAGMADAAGLQNRSLWHQLEAEAEHGGYSRAIATGIYRLRGVEMADALLAQGIKSSRGTASRYGSGKKHDIGAMTDARWQEFFDTVYPTDMDYEAASTSQFVNKKAGVKF